MFSTYITLHLPHSFPICFAQVFGLWHYLPFLAFYYHEQVFWLSNRVLLTLNRLTMANAINSSMDNMRLNNLNSLTHLLNSSDTDELNMIQHSPYMSDEELIQSRIRVKKWAKCFKLKFPKSSCKV